MERKPKIAGPGGGIVHFGFRLRNAADIAVAVAAIELAGGVVASHGEFCPGEPYMFFRDPDGYEVEIWYEPYRCLLGQHREPEESIAGAHHQVLRAVQFIGHGAVAHASAQVGVP